MKKLTSTVILPIILITGFLVYMSIYNATTYTKGKESSVIVNTRAYKTIYTDSALYVFPLGDQAFIEGLLVNHKKYYEYIASFVPYGMTVDLDYADENYLEYVTFFPRKQSRHEVRDTITFRMRWGRNDDTADLECIKIWTGKFSVGGIRVGDKTSQLTRKFGFLFTPSTRKIIIPSPYYRDYDSLRIEYGIPPASYYSPVFEAWEALPLGIKYNIRGDSVYSILSTNVWPNGDWPSPFWTDDIHTLY